MLRSYIRTKRQSKQNVTACVVPGRLRQIVLTGNTAAAPIRPINRARMVAGQSTSAEGEGKGKGDKIAYANTGLIGNMNKEKKSINLLRGWPSTSLLPAAALRAASQTALSDPSIWVAGLEYGPDPGYQPLREALARWLGRFYGGVIPTASTSASAVRGEGDESSQDQDKGRDQDRNVREAEKADRITITGGASQSLACLLQSFTDPAHTLAVWVVAPCYFLACPIFADAGFAGRLRAVPEDAEGPDVAVLEREMRALETQQKQQREKQPGRRRGTGGEGDDDDTPAIGPKYKDPGPHRKIYRHVVYCVPAFSNPSGRTMTLARRAGLVALARAHDALVLCDDVYDMLQWRVDESAPSSSSSSSSSSGNLPLLPPLHTALLPRLADLDIARGPSPHDPAGKHFGHAVSNGSFSKLVAPGTRTGWTYSTADFAAGLAQTGSTRSGGAASQLAATFVCELLLRGGEREAEADEEECALDAHIRHVLLPAYARRHALLMRAVRAVLAPLGVRVGGDGVGGHAGVYGGYFVWMTLPRNDDGDGDDDDDAEARRRGRRRRRWPPARAIADRCRADEALMIGNGELFAVAGDGETARFDDAIRLCFAWEDEADLVEGVERLGRVMRRMLDEGPESWGVEEGGELADVDQTK
ncbi:pyridoxal phosphate-dependent transferase [Ustulina deusta]|nr:pyridoxal phosphate-dependent transferase [Ustulina deusta]